MCVVGGGDRGGKGGGREGERRVTVLRAQWLLLLEPLNSCKILGAPFSLPLLKSSATGDDPENASHLNPLALRQGSQELNFITIF